MSIVRNLIAFSKDAEYLAYSSPDGCLKIWETSTSILKQEYTPSSHLSATCSSIAWGPSSGNHNPSKKFKKKLSDQIFDVSNLQLIALGTLTGDVLLYSFTNADLHTLLNNGHTKTVNDVCWHSSILFSCSDDHHIIIWDIFSGKIKKKWKANNGPIHSICAINENNIIAASNSIQFWDVKQEAVIKNFIGHGTETFRLLPINIEDKRNYFLSAAIGDRIINVWDLSENSSKRAVASFLLSDEPSCIDILVQQNEPLRMSVVCQDGSCHLFEHGLNGKLKKPVLAKCNIQIASKGNENQKPCSIPILAASISSGLDYALLSYGNFLKPTFERLGFQDATKDLFLVRNLSLSVSTEYDVTRVKQTEKPTNVKRLAPGHMTANFSEASTNKRKQIDVDIKELPMEERLKALDLSKTPVDSSEDELTVKSDSMIHLLLQGLQSKDNNMLNTVLQCGDEIVIRNTLERLPIQSIIPLLKILYERLNKREPKNHPCLKWFTSLITIHLPYFMSCQSISEYLIPFNQMISARKEVVCKMLQAQGILKMLLSQAASSTTICKDTPSQPLLEYESESSEESDVELNKTDDSSENEPIENCSPETSDLSDSDSTMED